MDGTTPLKKASFEIVGTNVADIGARLTLTNRLIREGVEFGSIENIGNKKIVVKLGGTKEDIEKYKKLIKENFESWLAEDLGEEERLRKKIGNPGIHYTELVYDDGLFVLPIDRHAHALECQQLRKGVSVFEKLDTTFEKLNTTLENSSKINEEVSEINKRLIDVLVKTNKRK